jgi:hypothetical protein
MEATTAGRAAQMTRSAGSVVSGTGDVLNASKRSIQKAIDDGELLKASAQLAGSVTGDVLATAGNVQIPGIGTVSKHALKSLGKVLQGSGRILHAAGDSMAQGQDQRDRQRELTTGQRLAAAHEQAIDFGTLDAKKPTLASEVTGGLTDIAGSGFGPIDDVKKSLTDTATTTAADVADSTAQGLRSVTSNISDAMPNSIDVPQLAVPHMEMPTFSAPQIPTMESLGLETPDLKRLTPPVLPFPVPPLDLPEIPVPEFMQSHSTEEAHLPAGPEAAHDEAAGENPDHASDFSLEAPNLTFLKPDEEDLEDADDDHDGEEDLHEEGEGDGDEDGEGDGEENGEENGDDDSGENSDDEDNDDDDDDEEEDEEKKEPEEKPRDPSPAADEEGPGGFTYHHDYRRLFDRLSTRPTMWQRIKRGASHAWSSVKNFFGFGKKDTLADHIGTSRRDRSVKPMLDRLSDSQSLSARMGRGVSNAWSSIKGFFGARPAPEEDDPASHIGDTIRRRTPPPKI